MKEHLVILHGFGTDSRVFASIGHKLSKDHDVMLVDLPGHGQTHLRPEDYDEQAKELGTFFGFCAYSISHALNDYLKEPYHILGWSMGGLVALEIFRQKALEKCHDAECKHDHNPIKSLILVSSTPKFIASDDFGIGMNKAVFSKFRKGLKDDLKKTMGDFYHLMFSENEDASKYLPGLISQIPSSSTLKDSMESFEKFDGRQALPLVNVPTLILTGDKDKIIDAKASKFMADRIKGSELKVFPDAGHAPFLTREAEVISEISKFLG